MGTGAGLSSFNMPIDVMDAEVMQWSGRWPTATMAAEFDSMGYPERRRDSYMIAPNVPQLVTRKTKHVAPDMVVTVLKAQAHKPVRVARGFDRMLDRRAGLNVGRGLVKKVAKCFGTPRGVDGFPFSPPFGAMQIDNGRAEFDRFSEKVLPRSDAIHVSAYEDTKRATAA